MQKSGGLHSSPPFKMILICRIIFHDIGKCSAFSYIIKASRRMRTDAYGKCHYVTASGAQKQASPS